MNLLKASINVPLINLFTNSLHRVDKKSITVLLSFLVSIHFAQAQLEKRVDSLQQIIDTTKNDSIKATAQLTLAETIIYKDPTKAKSYIDDAEALYKIKSYPRGYANLYSTKATYFYTQSAYDSSMVYLEKSGNEFMKLGDTLFGATIKSNLAIVVKLVTGDNDRLEQLVDEIEPIAIKYKDTSLVAAMLEHRSAIALNRGYRNIAIKRMKETIELREKFYDSLYLPQSYYKIGGLYQEIFEHPKAIEQFDLGIKISEDIGSNNLKAQLLKIKAMSQIELNQLEEASSNLTKSLELSKTINLRVNILMSLNQLANLEIKRKNFARADQYLDEVENSDASIKSSNLLYNYNLFRGELNLETNKLNEALKNFDYCLMDAKKNKSFRNLSWSKLYKSKVLKKMGKANAAYDLLKESSDAKDSLNNYLRTSLAQEQKVIFETNRKEKEIALQKSEIELLKEQEKLADIRQLLLGIGILSLIGIGSLLFYSIRQKMKRNKAEREKLDNQLGFKEKELTTHALHLAHKNEVLLDLKSQLKELKSENINSRSYQKVINTINLDINNDNNWEQFRNYFEDVHKDFNGKVMSNYPSVSNNDLRLMSLLKMNLSSKEIANILNISIEGVKKARYRLRKKLNLSAEDSLQELILTL
ncbi:hypothetical protein [Winogradskyella flava]|uniref:HTH luxR-type domain-containing protein n=1 Tax=Winogradskyella flava TaxID=1884876 RepID=A0A842IWF5_9FLAO|nr:hypothetical protein [Winogradskyella flava]MBC2846046.1 hypothetical protein [Winogradskyella flava]